MPIIIPKRENNFDSMIAQIMAAAQQDEAEKARLAQNESQFTRELAARTRVDDEQIGALQAQAEQSKASAAHSMFSTASEKAKANTAPFLIRAAEIKKNGGPNMNDELGALWSEASSVFGDDGESMRIVGANIAARSPVLPSEIEAGLAGQYRTRALESTLSGGDIGGGTAQEQNSAFMSAHGQQVSAQAFPSYVAQATGPEAVESYGRVTSELDPDAEARLQARTQVQTEAMGNAATIEQERMRQAGEDSRAAANNAAGGDAGQEFQAERADRILASIADLRPRVGLTTVGPGVLSSKTPMTPAYNFASDLKTLLSNIAFGELQAMRNASKTGGALGQVAVKELELLEATMGALTQGQTPGNFNKNLDKIEQSILRWKAAQVGDPASDPMGIR